MTLSVILWATQQYYHHPGSWMLDFKVYRAAVNAVLDGASPYVVGSRDIVEGADLLLFNHPPFALFVFFPFGILGLDAAGLLWTAISVAALQLAVYLCLRRVGVPHVWWLTIAITVACLLLNPVDQNMQWGQVSIVIMALVLVDFFLPDSSRFKGILIGLAAGFKVFPAVFALFYLLTGRMRATGTAIGAAVGTVALTWLVFPAYSADYWLHQMFNTARYMPAGWVPNESLRGMLARTMHSDEASRPVWLISCVLTVIVASVAIRAAHRIGEDNLAMVAVSLAALLVSIVAWHHYWVWSIPATILLVDAARRRKSVLLWACAVIPITVIALRVNEWVIPDEPGYDALSLETLPLITTSIVTHVTVLLLLALTAYGVLEDGRRRRVA
ncbi:glycosyltransferase 87 family protein [Nonomuraea angiospora]|uniref:glycosyltransferase 87 family protein n=1 Tax=Nonomuraea angiospora TaxID=46172 RepID=UPI0029AFD0A0|nr:glycosyltransferase 87 family protein [Nonomuraea angiospora]MDX3103361.1 glycosyltransferase 87 family protein [Nonomuraea angiospora]